MKKQTLLRVLKPRRSDVIIPLNVPSVTISDSNLTLLSGDGFIDTPYILTSNTPSINITLEVNVDCLFNYNILFPLPNIVDAYLQHKVQFLIEHKDGFVSGNGGFTTYDTPSMNDVIQLLEGDRLTIIGGNNLPNGDYIFFITPNQNEIKFEEYDYLDLYSGIPIKLNKSYAELQDISRRNSDFSIGLKIPGTKKNNRFFENFYDVDITTLFFDVTKITPCQIVVDNEEFFIGFLKLNSISVRGGVNEYDVTLYSTIGDILGKIGTNLLKDLNYNDIDYHFNHYFNVFNVVQDWMYNTSQNGKSVQSLYSYPIVHNGYEYDDEFVSVEERTRLFTPTVIDSFSSDIVATANGYIDYRLNSPINGLFNNQLKPAMNVDGLLRLMFKNYGYSIKSEFMDTPWFKKQYLYGIYSSDASKFSYKISDIQRLPLSGVEVILVEEFSLAFEQNVCDTTYKNYQTTMKLYVVRAGSGIPVLSNEDVNLSFFFSTFGCNSTSYTIDLTIPAGNFSTEFTYLSSGWEDCTFSGQCPFSLFFTFNGGLNVNGSNVSLSIRPLAYVPGEINENIEYQENDYINFSQLIDGNIKQIDILSSIAKKFNLVIVENKDKKNEVIIEPYDFYIGKGNIYDWSDKLSFDKGYIIEPALNYIESELILSDLEDFDDGNQLHKRRNNRIYGEKNVFNPTDFKSDIKRIDTNLAPNVVRKWYTNLPLPLSINYTEQTKSKEVSNTEVVFYQYRGLRSKPKLLYNIGNFVLPSVKKTYTTNQFETIFGRIKRSDDTNPGLTPESFRTHGIPVFSTTFSFGNPDGNKINNDSMSLLFNSEEPIFLQELGPIDFDSFTENDSYELFYSNRVNNLYSKNTRFLSGQFNLGFDDVQELSPTDLIRIKNKLFTWNKIDSYDVMNEELTKVELIQYNNTPREYPTRYFKYVYFGGVQEYKLRTYFNPKDNPAPLYPNEVDNSLRRTYVYWSVLFDFIVGRLGGNINQYASSFVNFGNNQSLKYTITEISEDEYNGIVFSHADDLNNNIFINRIMDGPRIDNYQNPDLFRIIGNNLYLNYGIDYNDLGF